MPRQMTKGQVAIELLQLLDENDIEGFIDMVQMGLVAEVDWEYTYGKESGHKTILQLALEEDDGESYVEELLRAGAKANYLNSHTGSAPIHTAASEGLPNIFQLLFKYQQNQADINVVTKDGLTPFHILLAQLIDLANLEAKSLQNRGPNPPTDEDIEESLINVLECLLMLSRRKDLRLMFNIPLNVITDKSMYVKNRITLRKVCTMTPLQILCSFQTWNAKPITEPLHDKLAELVSVLLTRGIDPNATGAPNKLPGTVPGSTPAVLLAATRGYYKVIEVFKNFPNTNFLIENKFKQAILHVVLKAGYYNKIAVHGDESGEPNVRTLFALLDHKNLVLFHQMKVIINRLDSYGNTPLHYAKPYPDQRLAKLLLLHGAKIDKNEQNVINVLPRTIEEHFYENCITTEGDDIDDEDFKIRINYKLFEKPHINENANLESQRDKAMAWTMDMEKKRKTVDSPLGREPSSGKLDTKRLEYFSDVDGMHYLLKHPVMTSFLEMELNSLQWRYVLDFLFYLIFVIILFIYFSDRYGLSKNINKVSSMGSVLYSDSDLGIVITYPYIILCVVTFLLCVRELYQMFKLKKRYFTSAENFIEWSVIILVILSVLPETWIGEKREGDRILQRHVAALTLLIAFMQLYLLLVRIVPNTPIPVYINMFTTVLKTYTLILLSYMAFILSFAYSFYLIFNPGDHATAATDTTATNATNATNKADTTPAYEGDPRFANSGLSIVKTIVMFVGEMDYNDFVFNHWLGYIIFVLFVFLVIIVLMNILNGLAVSDIHKIQDEVDTYYHISIVETLAYTSFVSLLAEEIILFPNVKPINQKIIGFSVPGTKVYKALGGKINAPEEKKKEFFFREDTVKAAKELISLKEQQDQISGRVTLESVTENIMDVKREQNNLKLKLGSLEENLKTIMEIMISRQPVVERM